MLLRLAAAGALVTSGLVTTALVPVTAATSSTAAEPAPAPWGSHVAHLPTPRPATKNAEPQYDPHTVLVRFKPGATAATRSAALGRHDATVKATIGQHVKVHTNGRATDLLRELRKDPSVAGAGLDYFRTTAATPNDPGYTAGDQPYLATARLPEAWNVVKDTSKQIIAVLDTGVDTSHEDLAGRTVAGYNAVTPGAAYTDIDGHGTMVAGIAAANTNNGIGVAGAAWTGRIMPVRVFHIDTGTGEVVASDSDIARGLHWAADHGARIVNLSLGGPDDNLVLHDAVSYANSKGVLVIAAAGNTGATEPSYPAAYPEALAVAATDKNGGLTDFSTSGNWVDVAAPGFGIVSTFFDVTDPGAHDWYASGDGTSFSSPLVAGIAAMIRTRFPSVTPAQAMATIKATARDAGPRGIDPYYGYGFVDAYGALGGTRAGELASPPYDGNDTAARATPVGGSATGVIGAAGDVDWYMYQSSATQQLQLTVTPAAFDSPSPQNLDPILSVYDESLHLLGTVNAGRWGELETLTAGAGSGPVYIVIRNSNGAADTRSYSLSIATQAGGGPTPGDQLWVREIAPGDFSTGAPIGVHPTVTFERDLLASSVTTATVRLLHGYTGASVQAEVAYDPGTKVATITPSAALQDNTPYRIVVGAVHDTGAATNSATYSSTFRTVDLAPTPVTGFTATGSYTSATLRWTKPAINDLSQIIVRRSTGGTPPATPTEGVAVYAGTGTSATASGLGWGGTYTFVAWVKDRSGKLSTSVGWVLSGTRLSVSRSTSALTYGGSVTVSGRITQVSNGAGFSGAAVRLYARQKGQSTWRLLHTATSSSTGAVSYVYKPSAGNDFQWRYLSGNSTYMGSGSSTVFTGVRTAVTAGLSRTTVTLGGTVAVSGSVSPNHAGQLVYLQRYIGSGKWANVTSATLSSTSVYSFHPKPTTRATWTYRVVKPADTDHLLGVSPSRSVKVT